MGSRGLRPSADLYVSDVVERVELGKEERMLRGPSLFYEAWG